MADVIGMTAERTLELISGRAPADGTPHAEFYDGIAWPTEREAGNIFWIDISGQAPIPEAFNSNTDLFIQPGLA